MIARACGDEITPECLKKVSELVEKYYREPQPGDDELLDAAKTVLRWNLSREATYTVPEELWPTVMKYGKELEESYGCEDIPLLLRANPYKLSVLAYSFALLEGFEEPTERHIHLAYSWLDYCAKDIELNKYVEWWKSQHSLSDEEYNALKTRIEDEIKADIKEHGGTREEAYIFKFIEYLAKNEKGQRDEIAAYANVEPETVSRKVRLLKGLGLLKSGKDGYHFTAKGVRFFRKWFTEFLPITDVTDVTTFKGQRGSAVDEKPVSEGGVTPKTSDFSDICDRKATEDKVQGSPEGGALEARRRRSWRQRTSPSGLEFHPI